MKWFKINDKEYDVKIYDPKESFTVLYSENTYRTLDDGAPMVFDPIGTFFNYTITIGSKQGSEADFEELWKFLSVPRFDPILVVFPKSSNGTWETTDEAGRTKEGFWAYVSSSSRGIKKISTSTDGELENVIYDAFTVDFIASKAQVLPE